MAFEGVGPGRLDMMGGVADYSGSLVLEVATSRVTTARASLIDSIQADAAGVVQLKSDAFDTAVLSLAPLRAAVDANAASAIELKGIRAYLQSVSAPSWTYYAYGSIAVFVRETGWLPPAAQTLVLDVTSTVPAAQGVSSSASIEVATIRSLIALTGREISALRTAHIAQNAENFVVGAPCGLMDQLASALGSAGQVLPILCRPDACEPTVPLPPGVTLVGWPSGVKHSVAASPYLTARTATFMGKKIVEGLLGRSTKFVAELSPSQLGAVLPRVPETITGAAFTAQYGAVDDALSVVYPDTVYAVRASVAFPVEENFRCALALSLLKSLAGVAPGSDAHVRVLSQIGELMQQTHRGYTAIGLGADETDVMIERAMALGPARGIYGARVSGGGSGGTVAVLCEQAAVPLVEALGREVTFGEAFTGLIQ